MDENNKLPAGWGDAEDDEDYGFPEADEAPWGAAASSDDSDESDDTETPEVFDSDEPTDSMVSRQNIPVKKKSYVPMIIGIAAVVMIAGAGGVFAGSLLSKDRAKLNEQEMTAETAMTVSSETDHVSMETVTESISETEMVQPDTQAETQSAAEVPYKVTPQASTAPCTAPSVPSTNVHSDSASFPPKHDPEFPTAFLHRNRVPHSSLQTHGAGCESPPTAVPLF